MATINLLAKPPSYLDKSDPFFSSNSALQLKKFDSDSFKPEKLSVPSASKLDNNNFNIPKESFINSANNLTKDNLPSLNFTKLASIDALSEKHAINPQDPILSAAIFKEREKMFGLPNAELLAKVDKLETATLVNNINDFKQLPTVDLSKSPVDGGLSGASGIYFGLGMNTDQGGFDRAKSSKSLGKPVTKFLEKMPPGTIFELLTDDIQTLDESSNLMGSVTMQVRLGAIPKFIEATPKTIQGDLIKQINKFVPQHIASKWLNTNKKDLETYRTLPPHKAPKMNKAGKTAIQLDLSAHDRNARLRLQLHAGDLVSAIDTDNPKTMGMNVIERALDHATIGLNYDATVMGLETKGLHGMSLYTQVRANIQDINSNHNNGNNPGGDDFIFVIGAESGNLQHESDKKKKKSIPLSKIGAAAQGLKYGLKEVSKLPGNLMVGYNFQFKPNATKVMLNPLDQRVYIANMDGKNIALPAEMSHLFDKFTANTSIPEGHPPVAVPDMTFEDYMKTTLNDTIYENTLGLLFKEDFTPTVSALLTTGLNALNTIDGHINNKELVDNLLKDSGSRFIKLNPEYGEAVLTSPDLSREIHSEITNTAHNLLPKSMITKSDLVKEFPEFTKEFPNDLKIQSKANRL